MANNESEIIGRIITKILTRCIKQMEEKYEQHKFAGMMRDLYRWLLTENNKSEYVHSL